jgi:acyl carrier protein
LQQIRQKVKQYIIDNLLMGADGVQIADDTSFLQQGLVDSTGVLELVTYLEDTFEIKVGDEDMTPDNLDSLDRIAAYVTAKRGAKS